MDQYYFFMERLLSEDDKEVKLSSMPFNVTAINNNCNFQMIRDVNFSFLSKPDTEHIFRLIAVKKCGQYLHKTLSDLLTFLESTNNILPNDQVDYILVKQFKMNMESDKETHVIYDDDDILCSFWKHEMKQGKYYHSNPQIEIDYIKLTQLVNNFVQ